MSKLLADRGEGGVIHIGFLSTIKTPSPDRNLSPHEKSLRPIGLVLLSAVFAA